MGEGRFERLREPRTKSQGLGVNMQSQPSTCTLPKTGPSPNALSRQPLWLRGRERLLSVSGSLL